MHGGTHSVRKNPAKKLYHELGYQVFSNILELTLCASHPKVADTKSPLLAVLVAGSEH
jgi:hypothetical protein